MVIKSVGNIVKPTSSRANPSPTRLLSARTTKELGSINDLFVRLVAVPFLALFLATNAAASGIDLTKIVGIVAGETWPEGKVPSGTGFLIGSDGQIMTAAHVVAGCHSIKIATILDGTVEHFSAVVVGIDARIDAALLVATSMHTRSYLRFSVDTPDIDDHLIVPTRSAVDGNFHAIDVRAMGVLPMGEGGDLLHVQGRLAAGSSGAPVVDAQGNVIGYIVGRMRDRPEIGLAVPADTLAGFLRYFEMSAPLKPERGIAGVIGALVGNGADSGLNIGRIDKLTVSVECF